MSNHICLYGILILFITAMSLQHFRIKLRKKITDMIQPSSLGKTFEVNWTKSEKWIWSLFRDLKRMGLLKKSAGRLPEHILVHLNRYKVLSAVELTVTISVLLAAMFAYKLCD